MCLPRALLEGELPFCTSYGCVAGLGVVRKSEGVSTKAFLRGLASCPKIFILGLIPAFWGLQLGPYFGIWGGALF